MNIYLFFIDFHQWSHLISPYSELLTWMFVFICTFMGLKYLWDQLHELGGLIFAFVYILITDDAQTFKGFKRKKYIGKALKIIGKNQKDRLKKVWAYALEQMANQFWVWFVDPSQKYLVIFYKTRRYMHLSKTHHDAENHVEDALKEFVRGKKWFRDPLHFIGQWLVIMHFKGSECKPSLDVLTTLVNLDNDCAKETGKAEQMVEAAFSELIRYRFKGEITDSEVNRLKTQLKLTMRELQEVFEMRSLEQSKLDKQKKIVHQSDQHYQLATERAFEDLKKLSAQEKSEIEKTEVWIANKTKEHLDQIVKKSTREITERFQKMEQKLSDTGSSLTKRRELLKKELKTAEKAYYRKLVIRFDKLSEYWFELQHMQVDVKKLSFWERCLNQVIWEDEMTMNELTETILEAKDKIHSNDFELHEGYQLHSMIKCAADDFDTRKRAFEENHMRRENLDSQHADKLKTVLARKKKAIAAFLNDKPIFTLPPALKSEDLEDYEDQ